MLKLVITIVLSLSFLNAKFIRSHTDEALVLDTKTNLMWEDKSTDTMYWKDAIQYCEDLEYGMYKGWRMPNYSELKSLVDYNKTDNATVSIFKFNKDSLFWTSSISAYYSNSDLKHVWTIDFSSGHDNYSGFVTSDNGEQLQVRCVHNLGIY